MYFVTQLTSKEDYSKHYKDSSEKGKFHKISTQENVSGENESKLQYAFSQAKEALPAHQARTDKESTS